MKEAWYFYADWCSYCQKQNPILDEFLAEHPEVNVVKILESENKDAVEHNKVEGFPTFIIFNDENPNGLFVPGLHQKDELADMLL
jgi:thiol-disulfide isomerase/thioredoxin